MSQFSLFVYGSFCSNQIHHKKIESFVTSKVPASVKAAAYQLSVGYPVVILGGEDRVPGELVQLEASDVLIRLLDEFHGFSATRPERSLYFRSLEPVLDSNGKACEAMIYSLNAKKLPKTAQKIPGGDWTRFCSEEFRFSNKLTEKQLTYIKRLGKAKAREMVPVDMQLYRELMGMELIVDKGRRLALSSFGKEVFRFLDE